MEDIDSKIKKIILEKFSLNAVDSTLLFDFVEDSIAKVEMLFEIEQLVGIRLNEEDLLSIETVGDLIAVVKKSVEKK